MTMDAMDTWLQHQRALSLFSALRLISVYFAEVCLAPSVGSLSQLHTTLRLVNEETVLILDLFDIDVEKLTSKTGTEDERAVVDCLVMLLSDTSAQNKLIVQLQNEAKKRSR